eukprot:719399-Pyramimonas_sp.AAC.1
MRSANRACSCDSPLGPRHADSSKQKRWGETVPGRVPSAKDTDGTRRAAPGPGEDTAEASTNCASRRIQGTRRGA